MLFSGHETFHIREGWLHKGLKAVNSDPFLFSDPHATDHLGVGKNMVSSIRYWLIASKLAEETKVKAGEKIKTKLELSRVGKTLWKYDPYLEEDLSLWIIHCQLASNKERATSWYWLFNQFSMRRFDGQTFVTYISRWITDNSKKKVVLNSLQKDLNCLIRTYTQPSLKHRKVSPEDSFECPLATLRLMDGLENTGTYKLNLGQRDVPLDVFGYGVLQFLASAPSREVRLNELATLPSSPGRLFLLSSESIVSLCERLEDKYGKRKFSYTRTAGLNLLKVGNIDIIDFVKESYEARK